MRELTLHPKGMCGIPYECHIWEVCAALMHKDGRTRNLAQGRGQSLDKTKTNAVTAIITPMRRPLHPTVTTLLCVSIGWHVGLRLVQFLYLQHRRSACRHTTSMVLTLPATLEASQMLPILFAVLGVPLFSSRSEHQPGTTALPPALTFCFSLKRRSPCCCAMVASELAIFCTSDEVLTRCKPRRDV